MAGLDSIISCGGSYASKLDVFNAVAVKNADGSVVGIRVVMTEVASPLPLIDCGKAPLDEDDFWRRMVTLDSNGKPALSLITEP